MTSNGSTKVPLGLQSLDIKSLEDGKPDQEAVVLSPRLLSYRAATVYLSVGYSTVRRMVLSGIIPHVRSGRRILIDVQDLDIWIEQNKEIGV